MYRCALLLDHVSIVIIFSDTSFGDKFILLFVALFYRDNNRIQKQLFLNDMLFGCSKNPEEFSFNHLQKFLVWFHSLA